MADLPPPSRDTEGSPDYEAEELQRLSAWSKNLAPSPQESTRRSVHSFDSRRHSENTFHTSLSVAQSDDPTASRLQLHKCLPFLPASQRKLKQTAQDQSSWPCCQTSTDEQMKRYDEHDDDEGHSMEPFLLEKQDDILAQDIPSAQNIPPARDVLPAQSVPSVQDISKINPASGPSMAEGINTPKNDSKKRNQRRRAQRRLRYLKTTGVLPPNASERDLHAWIRLREDGYDIE